MTGIHLLSSHNGIIIPVLVHDGFIKHLCDDGSGNSPISSGERKIEPRILEERRGGGKEREGCDLGRTESRKQAKRSP